MFSQKTLPMVFFQYMMIVEGNTFIVGNIELNKAITKMFICFFYSLFVLLAVILKFFIAKILYILAISDFIKT